MKIILFTRANGFSELELLGPPNAPKKQTFAKLKKILEGGTIMDWSFELWDGDLKCAIWTKLEPFDMQGLDVYVISISNVHLDNNLRWRI